MLARLKKIGTIIKKRYERAMRSHFERFVLEYEIMGDDIILKSTRGETRRVQNNRKNVNKINRAIVKNKIAVANKIDNYENHSRERLELLLINALIEGASGGLVILSFFTGVYAFLLFSMLVLIITSVSVSLMLYHIYIEVMEISKLKELTGYKREYEFKISRVLTLLKKSNKLSKTV